MSFSILDTSPVSLPILFHLSRVVTNAQVAPLE